MDQAVITTIIPTFRRPAMLQHAIDSALRQTWPHLRVAVCDNASGDETEEVVAMKAENDPRISYVRRPHNIGGLQNINLGVRAVATSFFSLLCDDDVLMPGFYEQAANALMEHPDAVFVAMSTLEVDGSGFVVGGQGVRSFAKKYFRAGEAHEASRSGAVPSIITGYVLNRRVVQEIGFLQEVAGPAADSALLRHVTARYPGVVLPGIAALIRIHPDSISANVAPLIKMDRSLWRAQADAIERDEHVAEPIRRRQRRSVEHMYVSSLKRSVLGLLLDGRGDTAREFSTHLRSLGYTVSAAMLRILILLQENIPYLSILVRRIGLRRRQRQQHLLAELYRRFEPRREEFTKLLHGRPR